MRLDKFEPIDMETMLLMLDLSGLKKGQKHIDLGSGNGQFVKEARKRGATSVGYEIDPLLAGASGCKNQDCFGADVAEADVVTCWFTKLPETELLVEKLYREMKVGSRLIKAGLTHSSWKPTLQAKVGRHWICEYLK